MSAETIAEEQLTVPGADTTPAEAPPADPKPRRRRASSRTRPGTTAGAESKDKTKPRTARAPRTPSTSAQVKAAVVGLHELGGFGLTVAGKPQTGGVLTAQAHDAAEVWAKLAQRYPAVERVLVGGGDAALFGALIAVYAPVLMSAVTEPRDASAAAGVMQMMGMFNDAGGQPPTP